MRKRFKAAFRHGYEDFRNIVSSLIQNGVELGEFRSDIDSDATAAALVGTWDALLLQAWFDDNFDPVTTAENFMTVVINGLVRIHHVE